MATSTPSPRATSARPSMCGCSRPTSSSAATASSSPGTRAARAAMSAGATRPTTPRRCGTVRGARLVLERDTLCQLGPEVTAYVAAVCQRRRERMAAEIDALVALRDTAGPAVLRSTVARALAREAIGAEYLPALAGLEPALALPAVPVQDAVDRDLASYEAFVQPGRAG